MMSLYCTFFHLSVDFIRNHDLPDNFEHDDHFKCNKDENKNIDTRLNFRKMPKSLSISNNECRRIDIELYSNRFFASNMKM